MYFLYYFSTYALAIQLCDYRFETVTGLYRHLAVYLVNKLEEETNFNTRKMANRMGSCINLSLPL